MPSGNTSKPCLAFDFEAESVRTILASGAATSLKEVRDIIDNSHPVEVFEPLETVKWDDQAERFEHNCEAVYA